jgi:streptogramin lyase
MAELPKDKPLVSSVFFISRSKQRGKEMRLRVILSVLFVFLFHTWGYAATCEYQFETTLGDSKFNNPKGVAVDTSGNVYVADFGKHRIQKFTSDGTFLITWGSWGSGDGQFSHPYGVAVDTSGNVYVADLVNSRIQKFTSDGTFLTKWGSRGSGDGQFHDPSGVAVDTSGNVYVVDTANGRIQKFTSDGTFLTKWGSTGGGDGQFYWHYGVAVDTSDNVYVADTSNHRIQKFTSDGTFLTKWGSEGLGDGQFYYPQGITVDTSGNFYVTDTGNDRIQKFTSDGTFLTKWGASGEGQFRWPSGVSADTSGNVYVADTNNHRIQKFTSDGTFLITWGASGEGDGEFSGPFGVAVDTSGNVYVADSSNHRIQKFTSDGMFLTTWGSRCFLSTGIDCIDPDGEGPLKLGDGQFWQPHGVAADTSGNVYVTDTGNDRIQKFTSNGTFLTKWGASGEGDGEFSGPNGVAADTSGNVYVADSLNDRIQKFTSDGTFLTKWGSRCLVSIVIDCIDPDGEGPLKLGDGQFYQPYGVAVDTSGNVYVADSHNDRIQKFTGYHTFSDITSEFWADDYISSIACAGITTGCGGGNFCPFDSVTRAQMAGFLIRSLYGEDFDCSMIPYFTDVSDSHWAFLYVQKLFEDEITTGCGPSVYCPTTTVTRAQMATFIVRAVEGEPASDYCGTTDPFTDVPYSHWACRYIKRLFELDITTGCGGGNYCPSNNVTRAQMAAFLSRAFLGME